MTGTTERILGHAVFAAGLDECVASIVTAVSCRDRLRWLACINPHSHAMARRNPAFAAALAAADWVIPDGAGMLVASRLLGGRIRARITGSDVFHAVNERLSNAGGARLFFIGSTEDTLRHIADKVPRDYPGLVVAGTYSPPFKSEYSEEELELMVDAINAAKPDVLWVGLSAPKQEVWICSIGDRLDVPFAAAIGAVFDFYTGRIRRASPRLQRWGLEWLPRLAQEPRRLWRRTFVSAPIFLRDVLRERGQRLRGGGGRSNGVAK